MTKDEILNMEAVEEMDKLVAEKVMGWHIITEDGFKFWEREDGRFMCTVSTDSYEDDEDFHLLHWHPSESVLWAWGVVERLQETGWSFDLTEHADPEGDYIMEFWRRDGLGDEQFICRGESVPLVICRGALFTTTNDKE